MATVDARLRAIGVSLTPAAYAGFFSEIASQDWDPLSPVEINLSGNPYRYAFDDDASHYLSITLSEWKKSGSGFKSSAVSAFIKVDNKDETGGNLFEYYEGSFDVTSDLLGYKGKLTRITSSLEENGRDLGDIIGNGSWNAESVMRADNGPAAHAAIFAGEDTIYGTEYDDIIDGGASNDTIYGLGGNDIFQDAQGVNSFYGGAGSDSFYLYLGRGFQKATKKSSTGFLINQDGKKSKKNRIMDPDVAIVEDYEIGIDRLFMQGGPDNYFVDYRDGESWLMNNAENNLVAIFRGVDIGLEASVNSF